jgi:molybdate transport system substrate-binding protein
MTARSQALIAAALGLTLAGCAGSGGAAVARRTVTVFAAASLSEAFTQIARAFEQANPGTTVTLNFGASSALAQQILAGAPADVFAAASPATMTTVTDAGDARDPEVFARNSLQIAVPPDNPGQVAGLADFARPELKIALCAEQVPCGAAAAKIFEATGISPEVDTLEQDVKAALAKVALGEVDAALVYRTDVLAAGSKVTGIAFPETGQAVNDYPLVVLTGAPNTAGASAFVTYVRSDEGQQTLAAAGFDRP